MDGKEAGFGFGVGNGRQHMIKLMEIHPETKAMQHTDAPAISWELITKSNMGNVAKVMNFSGQ